MLNLKQYATGKAKTRPGYRGGFPSEVERILKKLVAGSDKVLHLYSGRSDIGNIRVDLEQPEATHKMTVEEYISSDFGCQRFDWVILDPPYKIKQPGFLNNFKDARPLSGNALLRDRISRFLRQHADNVLWLDYCVPAIRGFRRSKIWLCIPNNCYENVRCLSWLQRTGPEFHFNYEERTPAGK